MVGSIRTYGVMSLLLLVGCGGLEEERSTTDAVEPRDVILPGDDGCPDCLGELAILDVLDVVVSHSVGVGVEEPFDAPDNVKAIGPLFSLGTTGSRYSPGEIVLGVGEGWIEDRRGADLVIYQKTLPTEDFEVALSDGETWLSLGAFSPEWDALAIDLQDFRATGQYTQVRLTAVHGELSRRGGDSGPDIDRVVAGIVQN